MTLLTPTAVHVGPDHPVVDLAAPAHTCPTCALYHGRAQLSRELHLQAEAREARQRDEIGHLETDNAALRAQTEPAYEPVKANRTVGGVA